MFVCVPQEMIDRDSWGHSYVIVRGEILGFVFDELLRFPFVDIFGSIKPCMIVFRFITLSGLSLFIFHYLFQVVFPSLGWSSVEMTSPGFHSAAHLVHFSWFCVAMRRACRHFSFFCVSTQVLMVCVGICPPDSISMSFNPSDF